jgi:hypothetical protein
MINGRADNIHVFESVSVFFPARGKPRHQLANCGDTRWDFDDFLRLADALAHPGEVAQFQGHSSII